MSTAILIGATGLVGSQLLRLLFTDDRVKRVVALGRRPCGAKHDKLEEHVVDFAAPESWSRQVAGDVLFSTLGTTVRKAGGKEAQYQIDHGHQLRVAQAARKNAVPAYVLVSSAGADAGSTLFYNRMKGELERDVTALAFQHTRILRPSILLGEREDSRPLEAVGVGVMKALKFIPGLRRYRPIPALTVAQAMIAAWRDETRGVRIYEPEELFQIADPAP